MSLVLGLQLLLLLSEHQEVLGVHGPLVAAVLPRPDLPVQLGLDTGQLRLEVHQVQGPIVLEVLHHAQQQSRCENNIE